MMEVIDLPQPLQLRELPAGVEPAELEDDDLEAVVGGLTRALPVAAELSAIA